MSFFSDISEALFFIKEEEYNGFHDEVAEWLRRWTANPLCSARVGSNPILVGFTLAAKLATL